MCAEEPCRVPLSSWWQQQVFPPMGRYRTNRLNYADESHLGLELMNTGIAWHIGASP